MITMSLPHALLGLINYHPATGYDLKIAFQKSIHFFWNAALPHIYRSLKQMEGQGWIISAIEQQEGKPNRKVYRITEDGQKELFHWLNEPPETPELRYAMLVKVFFGNQLPPDRFADHLKSWRKYYQDLLQKYETEVLPVIQRQSNKAAYVDDSTYWNLSLDFGKRHARMVIEWCDQALKDLEARKKKKERLKSKEKLKPANPVEKINA
jgi:PadR family transcriptional regulator, regulatory protein AphA